MLEYRTALDKLEDEEILVSYEYHEEELRTYNHPGFASTVDIYEIRSVCYVMIDGRLVGSPGPILDIDTLERLELINVIELEEKLIAIEESLEATT
ncbi:MAG: hypothetical protein GY923_15340 [Aestuariibacter sp.]|nr:hypothetical protein [Aestuariibacter sp.]